MTLPDVAAYEIAVFRWRVTRVNFDHFEILLVSHIASRFYTEGHRQKHRARGTMPKVMLRMPRRASPVVRVLTRAAAHRI